MLLDAQIDRQRQGQTPADGEGLAPCRIGQRAASLPFVVPMIAHFIYVLLVLTVFGVAQKTEPYRAPNLVRPDPKPLPDFLHTANSPEMPAAQWDEDGQV